MLRLLTGTAVLLGLASAPSSAQQTFGGLPTADWAFLSPYVDSHTVPVPDVAAFMAEDEARNHRPLRYGTLVPAQVDIETHGTWDSTDDGTRVWRLRLLAPGAKSVALEFSEFELPVGAQMFVYDDAREHAAGAFTHLNHQENGGFVFSPIPGEAVTLEVTVPSFVNGQPRIAVDTLIYDYRDLFELERRQFVGGGGTSEGSCEVGVNCPEGIGYEQQIRGTVRTLSGGGLCSGALLNNTAGDETQYILTANHCGQSSNCVFRFNYEKSGCGTGGAPSGQEVSGCTVLTSNSTNDNRLLRINNPIPASYEPVYLGWTRSTFNTTKAAALGHPGGGPKTISIDNNGTGKEATFWRVFWDTGILQGGNSGGPLIDVNGRVKGPACCVSNFDCNQQTAWFGRFDQFYNSNNLAQWLDPAGLNPTKIDLLDPFGGPGGGSNPPVITGATPNVLDAVAIDGPVTVTLTGTGFTGTTQVEVDGVALASFPPEWALISNTQITARVGFQTKLGPIDITVTDPDGSATTQVTIQANPSPTIELSGSDPGFVLTATGLKIYSASQPGDIVYVLGSLSNVPTVLPGLINSAIGNNGLALKLLDVRVINGTTGYEITNVPLVGTGLPPGTKLYVEGAVVDGLTLSLPAMATNLQTATLLF